MPDAETMRKGRPIKNPMMVPITTSRNIKHIRFASKVSGSVMVRRSLGSMIAMKLPAMASFTGAGRMRAPKNGERAIIGPMRAMIKKHKESTER